MAEVDDSRFWGYGIYIGKRIVYVGYTKFPEQRFRKHFRMSRDVINYRPEPIHVALNKSMSQGIMPRFKILAVHSGCNKENYFIGKFWDKILNIETGVKWQKHYDGEYLTNHDCVKKAYAKLRTDTIKQISYFK